MSATSKPKITMQLLTALNLVGVEPFRLLITGQLGTDATATEKTPYADCESKTEAQIKSLFGTKSDLTNKILRAQVLCGQKFAIWVIGMTPDATGVAATRAIAVTGTATSEAGKLTIEAIDSELFSVDVELASGTTKSDAATAIKAAIDAFENFPATSGTITDGAFTLTANEKGLLGNKYSVKITNVPAGLAVSDGQFASGTKTPVNLDDIFESVGETRFHVICYPWNTLTSYCSDFLDPRLVINNAFLQGMAYIGIDDTEANLSDLVNGTTPLNTPTLVFMGNRQVSSENVIVTPPDWRCVEFACIEGLRRTDGIPIANYVTALAPNDQYGGVHTCSLPYFNTPLALTNVAKPEDLFTETEQDNLADDGFSIIGVNANRTSMIMGDVVTTYKFNAQGADDTSLKYKEFVDTAYSCLELFFNTLKQDNSQTRLTEGEIIPGYSMQNQASITAQYLSIFQRLGTLALAQSGSDASKYFLENLTITLDLANRKVTSYGMLPIVTQLGQMIISFRMAFSVT